MHEHDFTSPRQQDLSQLEHYENGEGAPGSQHPGDNAGIERDLERYDDEEIATQPWPPSHS